MRDESLVVPDNPEEAKYTHAGVLNLYSLDLNGSVLLRSHAILPTVETEELHLTDSEVALFHFHPESCII